jgi:2-keto-4-pentenoate hydratase/2-oxohepta-3-ene-1,7-dioic acid hydratase in catechol pathway
LVATGTPAGVQPLDDGDEVEVEVVGWSRVKNRVAVNS